MTALDLTNVKQSDGKLTALFCLGVLKRHRLWRCRCECGEYRDVMSNRFSNSDTKSCRSCAVKSYARGPDAKATYRTALYLRMRETMSVREIAKVEGVTPQMVYIVLGRAKRDNASRVACDSGAQG